MFLKTLWVQQISVFYQRLHKMENSTPVATVNLKSFQKDISNPNAFVLPTSLHKHLIPEYKVAQNDHTHTVVLI